LGTRYWKMVQRYGFARSAARLLMTRSLKGGKWCGATIERAV